jgi:hypothetical protein
MPAKISRRTQAGVDVSFNKARTSSIRAASPALKTELVAKRSTSEALSAASG